MAGATGFEPANGGTKSRCLTTWRRPNGTGDRGLVSYRLAAVHAMRHLRSSSQRSAPEILLRPPQVLLLPRGFDRMRRTSPATVALAKGGGLDGCRMRARGASRNCRCGTPDPRRCRCNACDEAFRIVESAL